MSKSRGTGVRIEVQLRPQVREGPGGGDPKSRIRMLAGFAYCGIENRPERFQVLAWQNVGECCRGGEEVGLVRRSVASIGCPRRRYGDVRRVRLSLNERTRQFLEFLGGEMMAVSREDRDRGVKSVRFAIRLLDRPKTL